MYVKLNFTSDKSIAQIFRIVDQIINTVGITSAATLQSTATSNSWATDLMAGFDLTNSEIIRTGSGVTGLSTSNTVSKIVSYCTSTSYPDTWGWTVEFSRYDDTSKKYYINHQNQTNNGFTMTLKMAGGLSSGTLSGLANASPTYATACGTTLGSDPSFNSTLYTGGSVVTGSTQFNYIRTFVMYISDTALIWSATLGTTYNAGFGNTYSSSSNYIGPFIYSQYSRFDYTNTNNNTIIPLMFTNSNRGGGIGFGGITGDWTGAENTQYNSTGNNIAFRVFNLVNGYPTTGASFPVVSQPYVNWGVGSRYSDYAGLTASSAGTAGTATTPAYGPVIFTTTSTRFPSADLKSQTYGMLPVSWRNLYYYNAGGDASAKGGWYVFNGDYFPGDEYTYGGKTYKIIPTYTGYSNRVGIAIPKE